jgi:hypothetical protein
MFEKGVERKTYGNHPCGRLEEGNPGQKEKEMVVGEGGNVLPGYEEGEPGVVEAVGDEQGVVMVELEAVDGLGLPLSRSRTRKTVQTSQTGLTDLASVTACA